MAETVKKAKAPAKTRKATAAVKTAPSTAAKSTPSTAKKAKAPAEPFKMPTPSYEQIAELARKYWAERGYTDGQHEDDWFRAEQELRAKAS